MLPVGEMARRFDLSQVSHSAAVFDVGEARLAEPSLHEEAARRAASRARRCRIFVRAGFVRDGDGPAPSPTSSRCCRWPSASVDSPRRDPRAAWRFRVRMGCGAGRAAGPRRARRRRAPWSRPGARLPAAGPLRFGTHSARRRAAPDSAQRAERPRRSFIRFAWRSRRPSPGRSWTWRCPPSSAAPACRATPGSRRSSRAPSGSRDSAGAGAEGSVRRHDAMVYGVNAVAEALKARRVGRLVHARGAGRRVDALVTRAHELRIRGGDARPAGARQADPRRRPPGRGRRHCSRCRRSRSRSSWPARPGRRCWSCSTASKTRRTSAQSCDAEGAGAHGRDSAGPPRGAAGGATAKASAGAVNHVRIATVVNIARTLDDAEIARHLDGRARRRGAGDYDEVDYTLPTALVVGAEGDRASAAGARELRPGGSIPMRGPGQQPERLGGGRGRACSRRCGSERRASWAGG